VTISLIGKKQQQMDSKHKWDRFIIIIMTLKGADSIENNTSNITSESTDSCHNIVRQQEYLFLYNPFASLRVHSINFENKQHTAITCISIICFTSSMWPTDNYCQTGQNNPHYTQMKSIWFQSNQPYYLLENGFDIVWCVGVHIIIKSTFV
jgi:hypothetical protein